MQTKRANKINQKRSKSKIYRTSIVYFDGRCKQEHIELIETFYSKFNHKRLAEVINTLFLSFLVVHYHDIEQNMMSHQHS